MFLLRVLPVLFLSTVLTVFLNLIFSGCICVYDCMCVY